MESIPNYEEVLNEGKVKNIWIFKKITDSVIVKDLIFSIIRLEISVWPYIHSP